MEFPDGHIRTHPTLHCHEATHLTVVVLCSPLLHFFLNVLHDGRKLAEIIGGAVIQNAQFFFSKRKETLHWLHQKGNIKSKKFSSSLGFN